MTDPARYEEARRAYRQAEIERENAKLREQLEQRESTERRFATENDAEGSSSAGREFRCTVYGEAQPAGSKTPGMRKDGTRYVRDANAKAKDWKQSVAGQVGTQHPPYFADGPLFLALTFYRARPKGHYGTGKNAGKLKASAPVAPTTRPDTTKLVRGVEDALTGIIWRDDAQVCAQVNVQLYGEPARVVIHVQEVQDASADVGLEADSAGVPRSRMHDAGSASGEGGTPVHESGDVPHAAGDDLMGAS